MGGRDHGVKANSWWSSTVPVVGPTGTATTWVGVHFRLAVAGRIAGFRFYDAFVTAGINYSICALWDWATNRDPHRLKEFVWLGGTTPNQWNQCWFRPWFRPTVGTDYMVVALYVGGGLFRTNTLLASPVTHNGITFVSSFQSTALDLSTAVITENTNANAVDILFYPD